MQAFQPEEFVDSLLAGVFDGHVADEIQKLTYEQLERVAMLMADRLKSENSWVGGGSAENWP